MKKKRAYRTTPGQVFTMIDFDGVCFFCGAKSKADLCTANCGASRFALSKRIRVERMG